MSTVVVALRFVPLLVIAASLVLMGGGGRGVSSSPTRARGSRLPLVANLIAFGVWAVSLLAFSSDSVASRALLLAGSGSFLALVGVAIVVWSRAGLGPSWSFSPVVNQGAPLVTTGPYRLVRHPIYLGLALLALGEALAFASWPAVMSVLFGLVPTLIWRARTEEQLLSRTFGDRYTVYQVRTRMIIPYLF